MRRATCLLVALALACGDGQDDPAGPGITGNAELGRVAFMQSCASCHANGAGFDLAYFGFPASDIVRRAVKHVDASTASDIAAYIASLGVSAIGTTTPPFQPGGGVAISDSHFWRELFGTAGWPADMTAERLRAIDLRTTPVPLQMPLWSSEEDETDWLPREPVPEEVLQANDGALAAAIETYHASPGTPALLTAIERFVEATPADYGVCQGEVGAHENSVDCFEARRWMSAFAAIHFLQHEPGAEIPLPVIRLWWSTGEAAVTRYFRYASDEPRRTVSAWLYLAFSYAPTAFAEESGYLGQFIQSDDRPRLAMLTALRRMVAEDGVHLTIPSQRFRDADLAVTRGPIEWRADVLDFALRYLLETAVPLEGEQLALAEVYLEFAFDVVAETDVPSERMEELLRLHDQLLARIRG